MSEFPWRLVTIDIDGTLTTVHGWEEFARRTGRLEDYSEGNRRFFSGQVGEDEHLRDLLNLATGLTEAEVDEVLEGTPRLGGIREAVDALHRRGCRASILTHNPSYVCRWYLQRFQFDDWEGADATGLVDGRVPPTTSVRADKRTGLRRLLDRTGVEPGRTVHVGDARPDAELFPLVGGGVSVNASLPEVERAADVALRLTDLRPLVDALDRLRPRTLVKDALASSRPL